MNLTKRMTTFAAGATLATLLLAGAAHAASTVASTTDDSLSRIERILGDVDKAKEILTGKPSGPTDAAKAQETLKAKEAELEKARVEAMSSASGMSRDKVAAMRAQGKAWGDIARDLGVSPRVVGLGSGKDGGKDGGRDDDQGKGHGKKKGWKHGMPPGQAKKHGGGD